MKGSILLQEANLIGTIERFGALSGIIKSNGCLCGKVSITTDRECYSGNCHVTPKIESQVLNTCDKVILDDITVEGIPNYEVSNPQGGTTFIIGG